MYKPKMSSQMSMNARACQKPSTKLHNSMYVVRLNTQSISSRNKFSFSLFWSKYFMPVARILMPVKHITGKKKYA